MEVSDDENSILQIVQYFCTNDQPSIGQVDTVGWNTARQPFSAAGSLCGPNRRKRRKLIREVTMVV